MKNLTLSIVLAFVLPLSTFAWQLRGTVTDENGEPLPYISVYVKNSTYGVATNPKGNYYLELDDGTYTIVYQLIGYATQEHQVTIKGAAKTLDVQLAPAAVQLNELVISAKDKDPAYEIIKQAQKARKNYLKQYEGYSCNTYLKASLEKERLKPLELDSGEVAGPARERMNFVESVGETHFSAPANYKEIKTAYNDLSEKNRTGVTVTFDFSDDDGPPIGQEAANPFLYYLTVTDGDFNFYQNSLFLPKLGDSPIVSPIGAGAMVSYKFHLVESFYEDGKLTYKIEVTPRNSQGALFRGHIYIVDESWNIKAVDLEVTKAGLQFFRDFRIIQQYEKVQDSIWVVNREEFFYNTRDGKFLMIGHTLASYSNYQLNPTFPKRFFDNELSRIEDEAYDRDTLYWAEARPFELKPEEAEFVRKQDSVRQHESSEEFLVKQDSIYNQTDIWDILFNGIGYRNTYTGTSFYLNGLVFSARPLMVGGYHHSLQGNFSKEWSKANQLEVDYDVIYGFRNSNFKGEGEIAYLYDPKRFGKVYVSGGDIYDLINPYESINAVISRSNYIQKTYFGAGHRMEFFNGFYVDAGLYYEDQRSINNLELAEWSEDVFGGLNAPSDFGRYRQFIFESTITYTIKQQFYTEPYKKVILGSKYPKFQLQYRKGLPNVFGSNVNFDFIELRMMHELQLGTMGVSKYKLYAGRFLNDTDVRFIEHKWFRGSDRYWFSDPLRSFQLLGPSLNTANNYFQGHYIHHFNGALMNKIPLIKHLRLQAVGGAGMLLIQDNNFRHVEAYVGLEKPFKIKKTLMKVGVYFVGADSNHSDLDASIKIGLDFFNTFTNKWSY